jgi:hypothetical protein
MPTRLWQESRSQAGPSQPRESLEGTTPFFVAAALGAADSGFCDRHEILGVTQEGNVWIANADFGALSPEDFSPNPIFCFPLFRTCYSSPHP